MYETANVGGGGGGVGRLDSYNMPKAAAKLGLEAHAAELRGAIEETSKRLHALESRLTPILVPTPPMTTGVPANEPAPIRSQLLTASFDARHAVNGLMRHIESLLDRIEL